MNAYLRSYFSIGVIAAVLLWSGWSVVTFRLEQSPPGTVTVRLAHYQLEAGVRDAFDQIIGDYERLHPNVRIVQDAIPEAGYGQWATTQLVGGTAPDIIELIANVMPPAVLAVYATRYFRNLSDTVNQPNPYNAGTALEKIPLRQTYKDGMRNSYIEEAQRFVAVPLSERGLKIFYNKNLLKKLTGLDEPPTEYRAFLAMCEVIRQQRDANGQPFTPISCSSFHVGHWSAVMFQSLTYRNLFKADFNGDLLLGSDEFYAAYKSRRLSLRDPTFALYFQMMREVSAYFPGGWTGLQRDEAIFRFAQQRAVFMSVSTQEAYSLLDLAQGRFQVDIADFPQPAKDDPVYGPLTYGPRWEKPDDTFRFVVTRYSKHPDAALDFLLYLSSQRVNEKLNDIAHWVPCIVGAKTPDFLKKFDPHLEGVLSGLQTGVGVDTSVRWNQLQSLFYNNNISFEDLAGQFEEFLDAQSGREFVDRMREARRDLSRDETVATTLRVEALAASGPAADGAWVHYANYLNSRLMEPDYGRGLLGNLVAQGPQPNAVGPYEYSPHALESVRARLQRESASPPAKPAGPAPAPAPESFPVPSPVDPSAAFPQSSPSS